MSDLIRRKDTIEAVERVCNGDSRGLTFIELINDIPSAERKGRNLLAEYPSLFECSECGTSCHDTIPWDCNINYCPNCGARMKGADDDIV